MVEVYEHRRTVGISRTTEFERKKLATHAVNIGTKCDHDCQYCSSGSLLRMHRSFKEAGRSPFGHGYAIVDPDTPTRISDDARRIRHRGMVQLCTTTDAWSPAAQQYDLGRRCLKAILAEPDWSVRILTKNVAVSRDFDLVGEQRDRVLVGISITATPRNAQVISAIEPHASTIEERMAVLIQAHKLGLRTYAMLCPLLPGIADSPEQIDELVQFSTRHGAEEIFVEPVNARGPGLLHTQTALEQHGYDAEARALESIRHREEWSRYVVRLLKNVQQSVRAHADIGLLRCLLYPSRLTQQTIDEIKADDEGVIWLGRAAQSSGAA